MVKKLSTYLIIFISGFSVYAQTINIGVGFNQAIPTYEATPLTHHLSYMQYDKSQDLHLELKDVSSIPLPMGWVSFEGKNRWLVSGGLTTSRNVFRYDIDKFIDLGIRLITLDFITTVGYKINPFGVVTIIPEIGITNRSLLSARSGEAYGSGGFGTDYSINQIPELTGVKAGYLTNQAMDFQSSVTYARAGVKFKWYNFFTTVAFEKNLTEVDKRNQYKSVTQTYLCVGFDLLSSYLVKKQKPDL